MVRDYLLVRGSSPETEDATKEEGSIDREGSDIGDADKTLPHNLENFQTITDRTREFSVSARS